MMPSTMTASSPSSSYSRSPSPSLSLSSNSSSTSSSASEEERTSAANKKLLKNRKRVRISDDSPTVLDEESARTRKRMMMAASEASKKGDEAHVPHNEDSDVQALSNNNNYLSEQEKLDAWWSASDFAAVKDAVKRQCRDRRNDKHYSDCLTDAYLCACKLAANNTIDDEYYCCDNDGADSDEDPNITPKTTGCDDAVCTNAQPPPKHMHNLPHEALVRWVCDEGPRGLEVYSSRLHAMRRQRHLQECKHAVFLEQARQNVSHVKCDESLARIAAHASRRARTFAALLGQADAWVATERPFPVTAAPGASHASMSRTALSQESQRDPNHILNEVSEDSSSEEFVVSQSG